MDVTARLAAPNPVPTATASDGMACVEPQTAATVALSISAIAASMMRAHQRCRALAGEYMTPRYAMLCLPVLSFTGARLGHEHVALLKSVCAVGIPTRTVSDDSCADWRE